VQGRRSDAFTGPVYRSARKASRKSPELRGRGVSGVGRAGTDHFRGANEAGMVGLGEDSDGGGTEDRRG
jgi:hypothetical protein